MCERDLCRSLMLTVSAIACKRRVSREESSVTLRLEECVLLIFNEQPCQVDRQIQYHLYLNN